MYKLLIVDDEEKARKLIRGAVPWDALCISEIMESGDGLDAIAKLEKKKPDIMILDIKMPKMDGIELLERINGRQYKIKTVISSGYNDFEYAKKSFNMGIIDYILKPIQEDQLVEIITKCINSIEEEKEQELGIKALNDNLNYYKRRLREQVILDYIFGKECLIDEGIYKEVDEEIKQGLIGVIISKSADYIPIKEQLSPLDFIEQCYINNNHLIVFFKSGKERMNGIRNEAINISRNIVSHFHNVSIGLGRAYYSIEDLNLSYNEAMYAIGHKIIHPARRLFDVEELYKSRDMKDNHKAEKTEYIKKLVHFVKAGDQEQIRKNLEHIMKDFFTNKIEIDIEFIKIFLLSILDGVLYTLDIKDNENLSLTNSIYWRFNNKHSIESLYNCILEILFKMSDVFMDSSYTDNKRSIVNLAKEFIEQNFCNKISLSEVAKAIFITPSYLSKIFFEVEGIHFSDYIKKTRIDMAKELLTKNKNFRIYQVSEAIGYKDPKHFIKVFKNIEGQTPTEYRNRYLFDDFL